MAFIQLSRQNVQYPSTFKKNPPHPSFPIIKINNRTRPNITIEKNWIPISIESPKILQNTSYSLQCKWTKNDKLNHPLATSRTTTNTTTTSSQTVDNAIYRHSFYRRDHAPSISSIFTVNSALINCKEWNIR